MLRNKSNNHSLDPVWKGRVRLGCVLLLVTVVVQNISAVAQINTKPLEPKPQTTPGEIHPLKPEPKATPKQQKTSPKKSTNDKIYLYRRGSGDEADIFIKSKDTGIKLKIDVPF